MPSDTHTQTPSPSVTRHALKVALIYLLARGFSVLLMYLMTALPAETFTQMLEEEHWLLFFYPVIPVQIPNLPFLFQDNLLILPALFMETLLVFLFSSWQLRRKPWLAGATRGLRQWLPLVLAALLWAWLARSQLLKHVNASYIAELIKLQSSSLADTGTFSQIAQAARGTLSVLIYASMPLWALLPPWLHFRLAGKRCAHPTETHAAQAQPPGRITVFSAFLLGFIFLHTCLVLIVCTGLWPWAVEQTGVYLPWDTLHRIDLPLTLSQIVFALLAGILVSWIYACRPLTAQATNARIFIKPALMGMAAYLLTCLIMLALFWIRAYAEPGWFKAFTRHLERDPQDSIPLAIGLNIASFVILCLAGYGMRAAPRRSLGLTALLAGFLTVPGWVGWVITTSNMGTAGAQPGLATTGTLGDAKWRSMEQWCTGVVGTPDSTWLVGRIEESASDAPVPAGTPDLNAQINPPGQPRRRGWFGSRPLVSMLSRLQDDGSFKMMAMVPEVACLMTPPDSDTLFLLTGLDRPPVPAPTAPSTGSVQAPMHKEVDQNATFRSTDHGATWEMLEDGFMADAGSNSWNLKPVFASEQEVWAWGKAPENADTFASLWGTPEPAPTRTAADGTQLVQTSLFHSSDQGKTTTRIYSPEPFIAPEAYLRTLVGAQKDLADFSNRDNSDANRYIVPVDAHRAYVWISEDMGYRVDGNYYPLSVTTRATLTRANEHDDWQVSTLTREQGWTLTHVVTSADGRTYAMLRTQGSEWLTRLDTDTGEWVERHKVPSLLPGWLARNRMNTRYFQNNGDYQVISLWGDMIIPRILLPVETDQAEITTNAHFYTHDGGKTWHQLAIPGYLGVMGLSPHGSTLYWSKGNWFRNKEPSQWEYDLSR